MTKFPLALCLIALLLTLGCSSTPAPPLPSTFNPSTQTGPLRIAVIGLVHGHVEGLLWQDAQRDDLQIVGIYEPNRALFDRLAKKYNLDPSLHHTSLPEMLDATKPEAVSVMTSTRDHLMAVEACAPRGIHLLIEKPLAFRNEDARRMADLARAHGVLVLTNYETSWYASLHSAKGIMDWGNMPQPHKMIFRHGHKGPREIGCSDEFLDWLTDPQENGGGALTDFGCYGAIISTWIMNGQRPTSVTATATTLKPDLYPNVDDDATIILTYPSATAIIEASWCWTHDNKEADFYTRGGSIHAGKWDTLTIRQENQPPQPHTAAAKPAHLENEWTYLRSVVRGQCPVDPMSSLELNLIAVDILDQARKAVAESTKRTTARSPRPPASAADSLPPTSTAAQPSR